MVYDVVLFFFFGENRTKKPIQVCRKVIGLAFACAIDNFDYPCDDSIYHEEKRKRTTITSIYIRLNS